MDFKIAKGMFVDTAGRRWNVFYFDKNLKNFRAVMVVKGVLHRKEEYLTFDGQGRGMNSKYKLVRGAV